MQVFLFVALAISLIAVLFALQNIVPVTVVFLAWRFEGSLALVLFVALVAGALISVLASIPTFVKRKWAWSHVNKQLATLEASLAESQRRLHEAETRLQVLSAQSRHGSSSTPADTRPGTTLEPTT